MVDIILQILGITILGLAVMAVVTVITGVCVVLALSIIGLFEKNNESRRLD